MLHLSRCLSFVVSECSVAMCAINFFVEDEVCL